MIDNSTGCSYTYHSILSVTAVIHSFTPSDISSIRNLHLDDPQGLERTKGLVPKEP